MTEACIVGWAHTPFGKLEDPDVESLYRPRRRQRHRPTPDSPRRRSTRSSSAISTTVSAGRISRPRCSMQSVPDLRFKPAGALRKCLRLRLRRRLCRARLHRRRARTYRAGGRGGEETATPGAEVGDILLGASYRKEEADAPGGFAGVFGRIAETYFQRFGDQSDALATIAAKNHRNGVDNPYAQMRRDLGYDFCRTASEKNPYVAGPLKRTELLAGLRRGRGADPGGRGDGAGDGEVGPLPRRRACQRDAAAVPPRPDPVRGRRGGLGQGPGRGRV